MMSNCEGLSVNLAKEKEREVNGFISYLISDLKTTAIYIEILIFLKGERGYDRMRGWHGLREWCCPDVRIMSCSGAWGRCVYSAPRVTPMILAHDALLRSV